MTIEIQLSRGYIAIIDDEDADLTMFKWSANEAKNDVYAFRQSWTNGKPTNVYMHRVILSRMLGRPLQRREFCDHICNDGLDNRRSNLRLATNTQNQWNRAKVQSSKSGLKGAAWCERKQRYKSSIEVNNKRYHLGSFTSPIEAHYAYCKAALKYHGEFANFGSNSPFKPEDFE